MSIRILRVTAFICAAALGSCKDPALGPEDEPVVAAAIGGSALALTASPFLDNAISLSWQDKSSNEAGFEVHRSTSGEAGAFAVLTKTQSNVTNYRDAGLSYEKQYCYKVRSFRLSGGKASYSSFSNTACATTLAPPGLRLKAVTGGLDLDQDGYQVTLWVWWTTCPSGPCTVHISDWVPVRTVELPANGTVLVPDLANNEYRLTLSGDAANCYLTSSNSVWVNFFGRATVEFQVTCAASTPIAYVSAANGDDEIYTRDSRGIAPSRRLTFNPASDTEPAWSPDGSTIAFSTDRDGNGEIYLMNADGTNLRRLTNHPAADRSPSWSPDGTRIVFVTERDGNGEIYVMSADGSNQLNLTNTPFWEGTPAWSPDGLQIAFGSNAQIYVMNADGTSVTRPRTDLWDAYAPAWSPSGTSIAYMHRSCMEEPPECSFNVEFMLADGVGGGALSYYTATPFNPSWAPHGKKVAFTRQGDDWGPEIWITSGGGNNAIKLGDGFSPAWHW
jgi:Tol biopolymer transport system component